ncbi:MAG: hypothetical protein HY900_00270 [Deltaproteobacteria bacterium]|nr:hypothetical protein [Deltaproteobacteria bacterium]
MSSGRLARILLIGSLALAAFGSARSAEWQPGTVEPDREEPGQPCGVFKIEPGRAYFDRCEEPGLGPNERIGGAPRSVMHPDEGPTAGG